jgi:predicted nucleotidyltransferase
MKIVAEPEALIVDTIQRSVGACPVLLWGSRATGEISQQSDYDVFVVLPARKIPIAIRHLRLVAGQLENRLDAEVSVNPISEGALRRDTGNLCYWKLGREAKVLSAPAGFELDPAPKPPFSDRVCFSYLLSAVIYMIEQLDPASLTELHLPAGLRRGVRKALLHTAQLRLIRKGAYAVRLDDVLSQLDDPRLSSLAALSHRADGWFGVQAEVLAQLTQTRWGPEFTRTLIVNTQYGALAALAGVPQWRAALSFRPIDARLAGAAAHLLSAVRPSGFVDQRKVDAATGALPPSLRPREASSWEQLRNLVVKQWPLAHPLVGL